MKTHFLWFIFVLQLLCPWFVKAIDTVHPEVLKCARTLGLNSDLEAVLNMRQKVIQNPTEENWFKFLDNYSNFMEEVAKRNPATTPLHEATMNEDMSAINNLVKNRGTDVNIRGMFGVTPLFVASLSVMPTLLALGADMNARDPSGEVALHHIIAFEQPAPAIDFLLDRSDPGIIEAQDLLGHTPIIAAIIRGYVGAFHALRSRGASLNVNVVGATNVLLALYMYSNNTDLKPGSNDDIQYLSYADAANTRRTIRTIMARLILDEDPSLLHTVDLIYEATILHWAGFYGDTKNIAFFLERGLSPTVVNGNKETPLHVAARSNQVAAFQMLKDADPSLMDAVDKDGRTPAQSAEHANAFDILRVIRQLQNPGNSRSQWPNFFIP